MRRTRWPAGGHRDEARRKAGPVDFALGRERHCLTSLPYRRPPDINNELAQEKCMDRRKQRGRLLRRDKRHCGIHLGGCGESIDQGQKCNVDHIIPSAFFSKVAGGSRSRYEGDWNCQPMHVSCNQEKAAELAEWPKFGCRCHYLQVEEGHLFVRTRGRAGAERHLLLGHVVSDSPDKVDARVVVGPGKLGGQKMQGVAFGMKAAFGYMLPGIAKSSVDWFNLHEKARVGLRVPKVFELTDDGRVVPVGTEMVDGSLRRGDYSHYPSLGVPEGGIAIVGPRK